MERYTLDELYVNADAIKASLYSYVSGNSYMNLGLTASQLNDVIFFVSYALFGYFYDDLVAYKGEDTTEVKGIFEHRCFYDIQCKLPYWYRKYNQIIALFKGDISLLQTSKMTSSSSDLTKSASGSLQKVATTPTGVTTETSSDDIDITIGSGTSDGENSVETTGFVDKYSNTQQKYANANRVEGEREGEILREGSIDELLNILERLPSSFADEVCRDLQRHFIFDYDGEEQHLYTEE